MDTPIPTPPTASEVSSTEPHPLDPSIRTVWAIKYAGLVVFLILGVFFYDLTHLLGGTRGLLPAGLLTVIVLVLGVLFCVFWPRLQYRYWSFELRPEELFLEHGVLNHIRTIVPLRRIQHLDVSQDMLEREFSLGRLIVHTAGSRSSDVVIPGLRLDVAERMRDEVRRYILHDPLMEDPV